MNDKLIELVEEIENIRIDDEPVKRAWLNSCQKIGLDEEEPLVLFGLMLSNHPDLVHSNNSYHNHIHSAEAITSAAFLAKEEFSKYELIVDGPVLLFSMMCHDIAHTGKDNEFDYQLEKEAVLSLKNYVNSHPEMLSYWSKYIEYDYGKWDKFVEKIESIILGTDFKKGPLHNLKNYVEIDDPDTLSKLKLLANEADILPSCISILGPSLGKLLAIEKNKPSIGSWQNRLSFLKCSAKFGSTASKKIGIKEHINKQLEIINQLGAGNLDEDSNSDDFDIVAAKVNWELNKKNKKSSLRN